MRVLLRLAASAAASRRATVAAVGPSAMPRAAFASRSAVLLSIDMKKIMLAKRQKKLDEKAGIETSEDDDDEPWVDPEIRAQQEEEERARKAAEEARLREFLAEREEREAEKRQRMKEFRAKQMEARKREAERRGRDKKFNPRQARFAVEEIDERTEERLAKGGDLQEDEDLAAASEKQQGSTSGGAKSN